MTQNDPKLHLTGLPALLSSSNASKSGRHGQRPQSFSRRQGALDLTIAHNRTLEADVKVLEAKLKARCMAVRVHAAESPPPRRSSSRPTLVNSPQKRKALAPDRVRSAPPISPARSIRELVPPPGPQPTFFSPRRPLRTRSSPSPPSPRAMTPSPVRLRSPSLGRHPPPPQLQRPRAPSPRLPPPPAIVALDAHLHALEDGMAESRRERDRLAALPAHPAPADPTHFARVGLLGAECVRLRRRVRELEAQKDQHLDDEAEDPDTTIRPTRPLPAPLTPLLPPIELRPSTRASPPPPLVQQVLPRPYALALDARHIRPPDAQVPDVQGMAQLAAELARAQDSVAERERAMDGLREEIARLRGAAGA
ncbi:hypothetical protein AURDEDRAFT_175682 [Auricularia subglabra TFB-10046 SS5]|uniref:Uncharacterized protein n=1 Tax=Auricularia subglabra (strain TFB-10046 / SS5) TaxID=717982 RepID=J0D7Y8_AURST|nr:hypothetical protein AURDEDRAFT_175682 [Auricularia subglabra TFB-10046 SS5]